MSFIVSSVLCISVTQAMNCAEKEDYYRCDFALMSQSLAMSEIPVFVYLPKDIIEGKSDASEIYEYVLFLHGRGYSRNMGAKDSMLEHLQMNDQMKSSIAKNLIFVAPQDVVLQSDSKEIGQDYWVGAGPRNWQPFFSSELPAALEEVSRELEIQSKLTTVMGISMGPMALSCLVKNLRTSIRRLSPSPLFFALVWKRFLTQIKTSFLNQVRQCLMNIILELASLITKPN